MPAKTQCTVAEAQAEFAKNEQQIAELQTRNSELEAIMAAKGSKVKRALQDVSNASNKKQKTVALDETKIASQTSSVTRKVQGQIGAKLKWKSSYKAMRNNDTKKGGRVEVVCQHPEVFERIFEGADIKTAKDGKLSCTFKTDDEVFSLPFKGKSYPYNSSELRAPCSASFKDGALTFSFKYSIE